MLQDFAKYYEIARRQGNKMAMRMIKKVIISILEDAVELANISGKNTIET